MTFWGIERKRDRWTGRKKIALASWPSKTAKPPLGACEWLTGRRCDFEGPDEDVALPGRRLYMVPKDWRRPTGMDIHSPELAEAIENACRTEEARCATIPAVGLEEL